MPFMPLALPGPPIFCGVFVIEYVISASRESEVDVSAATESPGVDGPTLLPRRPDTAEPGPMSDAAPGGMMGTPPRGGCP